MNEIELSVSELKPALAGLGKVIGKRAPLPYLGCVRIERARDGRIEIAGAGSADVIVVAGLHTPDPGPPMAILVRYEDLNSLAKNCSREDKLRVGLKGTGRAVIKASVGGQIIEHQCESLSAGELPPIPVIQGAPIAMDDRCRRCLIDSLDCASTDPTRPALNGVYLDVSDPKMVGIVATDGKHLLAGYSSSLAIRESLLIPAIPFLSWKEFENDGPWTLRVEPGEKDAVQRFEIASPNWRLVACSEESVYPNWKKIVNDSEPAKTVVELSPSSLEETVRLLGRLPNGDKENAGIGIEVERGQTRLLGRSQETAAWGRSNIDAASAKGQNVTVFLDRRLLAKALHFGLHRVEIVDNKSPVRVSDGDRLMLIMPLKPSAVGPVEPSPGQETQQAPPSAEPEENGMTENNGHNPRRIPSGAAETEKPALDSALAQLEGVRGQLRDAQSELNKLGDLIKQAHKEKKASEKDVQTVRATLEKLQSVRI